MIDTFGHIFYAIIMIGMFQIGRDRAVGWVLRFVGDCGWMSLGFALGLSSVVVWGAFFLTLDVVGWLKCRSRATLQKSNPSPGEPA